MKQIRRVAATLAASAVIVMTTAASPALAAPSQAGQIDDFLSFLRSSAEALIVFVNQVLA